MILNVFLGTVPKICSAQFEFNMTQCFEYRYIYVHGECT